MKKITVMIVDDDRLAIEDFISLFDWEANGFEILATAFNGKQALEKFRKLSPQLVIADIKMPIMDGLELTHEIRKLNFQTKIILLTAYGEFEYAKLAIKDSVKEYWLKSEINEQTLNDKLLSLKEQISTDHTISSLVSQKVITDLFSFGTDFVCSEISSDPNMKKLFAEPYYYLIVEKDLPLPIAANYGYKHELHYENEIISCCKSISFSDYNIKSFGFISHSQILLVIQSNDEHCECPIQPVLINEAKQIQKELKAYLKSSFSIYIIHNKMCLSDFYEKYLQLSHRMYAKYLLGCGNIFDLQDEKLDCTTSKVKEISVDEKKIAECVDRLDSTSLLSYIDELYTNVLFQNKDYDDLVRVTQSLYIMLKKYYDLMPPIIDKTVISLPRNGLFWLDIKGINSWMKCRFKTLIDDYRKQIESRFSREVIKAMEFIYRYFSNKDLKINQIAYHVGFSSGRLSVIFKKETGRTVNEFITDHRIKKAKDLLDEGYYKVYQVANMVGYSSSQYFSQIFYLKTGIKPNDYRKGIK